MSNHQREAFVISDEDGVMEVDNWVQEHHGQNIKTETDLKTECTQAVLRIFRDVCPEYLEDLAVQHTYDHEAIISAILDQVEGGKSVPKRVNRKRKRESEDVGDRLCDLRKKYDNPEWREEKKSTAYVLVAKALLRSAFPNLLVKNVLQVLADNNNTLFPAYLKLVQKEADDVWKPKKKPSKSNPEWEHDRIDHTIRATLDEIDKMALEEFKVARQAGEAWKLGLLSQKQRELDEKQRELEEVENYTRAIAEGTTGECECCCDEFALNRMVHCDSDTLHWFCRNCARLNAETQIGLAKFELRCMSMDGCTAGFSRDQKDIFLDEKTTIALERIEQEAALRLAGIENLETCPFCPYAAEYPPVESDKEFRCQMPECEIVSCRLCRKETHIPKSCAEAALEEGHSGRRAIEEAMSAALIRKCNRCTTPFIKESGCNKMMCTKCYNTQCYVCNKSCDYSHFNDPNRGGKAGNCPLFDNNVEKRHQDEVRRAEKEARKQVQEEHPDIAAELFEFNVSDKVKEDEKARRKLAEAGGGAARVVAGQVHIPAPPGFGHPHPG